MGEPDRVEQLLSKARARFRQEKLLGLVQALPYVAVAGAERSHDVQYSMATGTGLDAPGRRYTGRSTGRPANPPQTRRPVPAAEQQSGSSGSSQPILIPQRAARAAPVPWSLRLVLAVSLVSMLLLVWRSPGLFTPPVDGARGVESTHAAFVNVLAGRTEAPLDNVRLLPPPAPWYGNAPAGPATSLPVYAWLSAGLMMALGAGAWVGRAVSIFLSLLAGLFLFATVRRTAGARAALYSMLFYSVSPLSVVLGQQFSPAGLLLAAQSWAVLAVVRWRTVANDAASKGPALAFGVAVLAAAFLGLVDPAALFMSLPICYVAVAPSTMQSAGWQAGGFFSTWKSAWSQSPDRGKAIGLTSTLGGASILWWAFSQGAVAPLALGVGDGGGGVASAVVALLSGGTYVQIVGLLVERVLTVAGLLLLGAGLLNAARPPFQMIFHAWLVGGLIHVLVDASRLPGHDDVLLPLILPACALAGIGAAWAGALPARLWLAVKEQTRESDSSYAVSPHTAWLLDLPEERIYEDRPSRPQAQLILSKSVAQRSQTETLKLRRAWLLAAGHVVVFTLLAMIVAGGVPALLARVQPSAVDVQVAGIGQEVASLVPAGARIIVAGPFAPGLFYSAGRTGWALGTDDFSMANVQSLQSEGAAYLVSADQVWLGHHPDYRGLITSYSVLKLSHDYILFDLNKKPADSDRLYFLESGHTLGGAFRAYWDQHGGVAKLGYPISEEQVEASPLDGQMRTVQYFERAVLEYHKEKEGTPDVVMLASVGLWVTQGRAFPRVAPFQSTDDNWYFAATGHSVKQAFLRYWQQGGLAMFGYPISEELPEINPGDGKVYTVQYFERARFEWHPTFAASPDEVQLGLIGKQALERASK